MTMDRRHLVFACVLALTAAPVCATSAQQDDQDAAALRTQRTAVDGSVARDAGSAGDAAGMARTAAPTAASSTMSDAAGGVSASGHDGLPRHHVALGWQSLLPGSIQ